MKIVIFWLIMVGLFVLLLCAIAGVVAGIMGAVVIFPVYVAGVWGIVE